MTSQNNFATVQSDGRNSSRVLKPPGGGHTDIFGIYDEKDQKPQQARNNIPKSTIHEVFSCDNKDETAGNEKTELEDTEIADGLNGNENEAPKPTPATPQRSRVPPGGYSSGLW